ncbi:MAG: tripartite tricarboxylate transporter TctB family protein [Candidatus Accumulibacter sp.]|jgi:putative tricarboxylic transport membrane protein|nr:tripartite tricarboxylate transporter TctB family protein [Accumulibacter sp.]
MKTADIVGGVVGMLIGLLALWEGSKMPTDVVMKIGPSYFPNMLAALLIVFSAALLINALRGLSKGKVEAFRLSDQGVRRGLVTLGAAFVFCVLLDPLGFLLTSEIFLVFMIWMLGKRGALALLVAPPVVTVATWLLFEKVLYLSLPAGVLADIL